MDKSKKGKGDINERNSKTISVVSLDYSIGKGHADGWP
jgi:hypothetical protein